MTPRGRRAAGAVLVAVLVQTVLATGAGASAQPVRRTVALVMVPDLTWSTAPAALDGFAKANLSPRTAHPRSGAADTYVTLGKGGRSAALTTGRVRRLADGSLVLLDWPALQKHDNGLHYGGMIGTVGETLRGAGRRWALAADDLDAAPAAATASGTVPMSYPATAEDVKAALKTPLDALVVAAPAARLPRILDVLDGVCTLVVSASTPGAGRHLGVLAASRRCGLGTGGLASPSTGHGHLATLPDVSASFLDLLGVPVPAAVAGGRVTAAADVGRAALVDRDRRASTADRARLGLVWLFVVLHALGALAVVRVPRARSAVCCALLSVPPAGFLMMLVPWWRAGPWAAPLAGALVAVPIALVGTVLARGDRAFAVGALTAFAAAVVAVDALFASPLQVDAPFGNSPVGAGRFFGVGNIGSGFLVAGALVAGGLALERGGSRARRWVGAALAAAVVAGGAPPFGADVGGVLFAVPAYGVLLVGARRARIAARHVVLLAGAAVVAVALFAAVDLLRAAGSQTHLARSLAGQGIADEVVRKAGHALRTAIMPMTALVGVAAAVLPFLPRVPGRWRPRRGSYALLTAGVLGSLLNDSGLLVGAAVAAVAWPAAVLLAPESQDACATRAAPA